MEHNRFDYANDIVKPLKFFLSQAWSTSKGLKLAKSFGMGTKSQYFNNYEEAYKPKFEIRDADGNLIDYAFTNQTISPVKADSAKKDQELQITSHKQKLLMSVPVQKQVKVSNKSPISQSGGNYFKK